MIIDFHTHVFPDAVAKTAIPYMSGIAHTEPRLNGTLSDLQKSMKESDITCSIVLPVVTKPAQFHSINQFSLEHTASDLSHLDHSTIFFGGIHPDTNDYKKDLNALHCMGFKGIKLHPDYQEVFFDDIRYMRIIDYASELGFIISVHAGIDPGFPNLVRCTSQRILNVIDTVHPEKLVLAHTGGWKLWDEVEHSLAGLNLYMDTSNSLTYIEPEQFLRIIRKHGINRILFATDSPWESQTEDLELIRHIGLSEEELDCILGKNAASLLQLPAQI